ncbi:hypothetical protein PHMEG_00021725 [Phytophthora megakarya]|uniref:Uncharacterized protein n=1 Tax=Phytophthora megakarya TaxID=4795 RepID=A0A225VLU8_9STRA|nr:hypothetical protein PHMEG_00021725 [Phytophthora megakarya]
MGLVNQDLRDRMLQIAANPGNAHWCCEVVRVSVKRICYYDPLNQTLYLNTGNAVSTQLNISGLQDYDLVQMNNQSYAI